jgi:hypothetical protein
LSRCKDARNAREPICRVVDLNIGEKKKIALSNGCSTVVKLHAVHEERDDIRGAVRRAEVKVAVDGVELLLASGNYHLPIQAGNVLVDCPVTRGYPSNATPDETGQRWALSSDARFRLWPANSPLLAEGTFGYPVRQRWFASATQMANEPVYVNGGEDSSKRRIYYHDGLDIGGAEGMTEVLSAVDGIVLGVDTRRAKGSEDMPFLPAPGRVYAIDDRGWLYEYAHLKEIYPSIEPGMPVTIGQPIGLLGKEGKSGGWAHLHFNIKSVQPSGARGTEDGYAYLWEAYVNAHKPRVLAVARPHQYLGVGRNAMLDGSRSRSFAGRIQRYEWMLSDGSTAEGPRVEHAYEKAGTYSEILKVTDENGNIDYDFAAILVVNDEERPQTPLGIHAAFFPTLGAKPGDPVTFKVRSFNRFHGGESLDFGDGTPPEMIHSDGNLNKHDVEGYAVTTHTYRDPGHYIVRAERENPDGARATNHLHVIIG